MYGFNSPDFVCRIIVGNPLTIDGSHFSLFASQSIISIVHIVSTSLNLFLNSSEPNWANNFLDHPHQ